ncbi:diguanylate cyclase [Zavarzinella formosa]|uniref:diguanylate cyclase n=1 Tax=Zavarzinella formosa TaxID=360055 RepID=UPI0002EC8C8E|nr:diguanylate cyclase [Zavarzinella formosa]
MNRKFDRRLLLGVGLIVGVLSINSLIAYRNIRHLDEDSRWVAHTYEVLDSLSDVHGLMRDAQAGMRGYLLSDGDPQFLEPYQNALAEHANQVRRIEQLTADNPRQRERMPKLWELDAAFFASLDRAIDLFQQGDGEAARKFVKSGVGKRLMDEIRALIREMEAEEEQLLKERELVRNRAYSWAVGTVIVALLVGISAVGVAIWLGLRSLLDRSRMAAVRYQQEFLQATITSLGDGVIVTDPDGRVTALNRVAEQLTGWTQKEAAGQPMEDVFRIINADSRQPVPNPLRQALAEDRVIRLEKDAILLAKDGKEWPLDDSAAPIHDDDGRVTGGVLVFKEISERFRVERELAEAARRQAELLAEVRDSEAKFRNTIDRLAEGIFVTDIATQKFIDANSAMLAMLGYSLPEFLALTQFDLVTGVTPEEFAREAAQIRATLEKEGRCDLGRRQFRRKNGSPVPVDLRITVVPNGGAGLYAEIVRDVTEQVEYENSLFKYQSEIEDANVQLRTLATTDALTKVKNRRAFNERLSEDYDRAVRHHRPLSVILMDVDHFKLFNDSFGHPAGDEVLKAVAACLQSTIRSTDTVARYGGEEFAVILPDADYAGAMVLAERCRRAIAATSWDKRTVTVSVGVSTLTPATPDATALVQEADQALYRSKHTGRNRVTHVAGTAG